MIYLDHAATTPVREDVLAAMLPYFSASYANPSSVYRGAQETRRAIDSARGEVAAAIGADTHEIYFTSGGSEADNWAIMGAASAHPERKHIITTRIEHHAVLHACRALERCGYEVTYLNADALGRVSVREFEKAIRSDTLLASIMLANNEVGTIEPIAELSESAKKHGVLLHTDAVQAVGHISVDVNDLGVDMLSLSAHKFGGPKGMGALYIRAGTRINNLIYGGAQERNMRAGTENTPGIVGMGKAITGAVSQMENTEKYVRLLRDILQSRIGNIEGVRINGDPDHRLPGHLHVTIRNANTQLLLLRLDMEGIAVSAGSACSSGASERSHVIQAMGLAGENQADIRFSIGESNTEAEIEQTVTVLRRILKR